MQKKRKSKVKEKIEMISTAIIMKTGLIIIGVIIMVLSFVLYAKRKLTVNLAVVWEFLGFALILTGAVPYFPVGVICWQRVR